jgi:hypothetical protein
MCFIPLLFASTLPVVATVTMRTSISFHHLAHGVAELVGLWPPGVLNWDFDGYSRFVGK